jgi:hypothetical protein
MRDPHNHIGTIRFATHHAAGVRRNQAHEEPQPAAEQDQREQAEYDGLPLGATPAPDGMTNA